MLYPSSDSKSEYKSERSERQFLHFATEQECSDFLKAYPNESLQSCCSGRGVLISQNGVTRQEVIDFKAKWSHYLETGGEPPAIPSSKRTKRA